jgi:hypothetical protein
MPLRSSETQIRTKHYPVEHRESAVKISSTSRVRGRLRCPPCLRCADAAPRRCRRGPRTSGGFPCTTRAYSVFASWLTEFKDETKGRNLEDLECRCDQRRPGAGSPPRDRRSGSPNVFRIGYGRDFLQAGDSESSMLDFLSACPASERLELVAGRVQQVAATVFELAAQSRSPTNLNTVADHRLSALLAARP